uniref:Cyclic-phosphate processing Receiver domain-containing protein n=1 Tax=Salmonella phage SalP219 TaxID=3158864 RepID=A0AAU7PJL7_9CAUD
MIVWLDDLRDPIQYGVPEALWIKNSQDFMKFLNSPSKHYRYATEWHFDNDLGEQSESDGYSCFLALEEKIVFGKILRDKVKIFVHTSNPSAGHKFMLAKDSLSRYGVTIIRNNY